MIKLNEIFRYNSNVLLTETSVWHGKGNVIYYQIEFVKTVGIHDDILVMSSEFTPETLSDVFPFELGYIDYTIRQRIDLVFPGMQIVKETLKHRDVR